MPTFHQRYDSDITLATVVAAGRSMQPLILKCDVMNYGGMDQVHVASLLSPSEQFGTKRQHPIITDMMNDSEYAITTMFLSEG